MKNRIYTFHFGTFLIMALLLCTVSLSGQTGTKNYIKATEYLDETADPDAAVITVQYFDGLGRPEQTVSVKATPDGKDIVTKTEYDGFGRQAKDYLPVPVSQSNGNFINPDNITGNYYQTNYTQSVWYSEKTIENSPLNRVMAQAAPGDVWAKGGGHEIEFRYLTNTFSDFVKIFKVNTTYTGFTDNGYYEEAQLYKAVTVDENGNAVYEFKDKQGQVVLKRTQVSDGSTTGKNTDPDPNIEILRNADTYYVYDIYGNLAFVIPPLASAHSDPAPFMDELCYQYRYDERNRLVEKKLPGKGWEAMVYDKQDRLVATQDRELKNRGKWLFTKYDKFGRVVYTGIYSSSASRSSLQSAADGFGSNNEQRHATGFTLNGMPVRYTKTAFPTSSFDVLTVNYYDSYDDLNFTQISEFTEQPVRDGTPTAAHSLKGMATASMIRIMGTYSWERTFMVYDGNSRPVGTYKTNHLGGRTKTESKLNFRGLPEFTVTKHKRTATGIEVVIRDEFTYDSMERPDRHTQSVNSSSAKNLIAKNEYDPLGQLITKKVGGTQNGSDRWQEVDYRYNIRGWLTRINDVGLVLYGKDAEPPTMGDDLFAFRIQYNELANGGNNYTEPLYNGNIAQTFWKTADDNIMRGYHYTYDQMNRLRRADFYKSGNAGITAYGEFISYDLNGNIKNLYRSTGDANDNEIDMDNLTYDYHSSSSNILRNVTDAVSSQNTGGFKDGNTGPWLDDYAYDENGNMTLDRNKGITEITYNHLNLPVEITWSSTKKIEYIYNAAGQKVQKKVTDGNTIKEVDYLDGFQYAGGILQFFPHPEGYVRATPVGSMTPGAPPASYAYNYVYNYTDHLGNVRLSYSLDPQTQQLKILDESHYYPFGLKHSVYTPNTLKDFTIDDTPGGPGTPVLINVLTTEYMYKFQGQERQDELGLNWDSFKWRNYDPAIGRFFNYDPLAEKYSDYTPYQFSSNQVVHAKEIEGLENSADLNQQRWQKQYLKGEISNEQLMDNYQAQFNGAVTGLSIVLPVERLAIGVIGKIASRFSRPAKVVSNTEKATSTTSKVAPKTTKTSSKYQDTTNKYKGTGKPTTPNRSTDVNKKDFEKNLQKSGFEKTQVNDKVNKFEKDGSSYTTRPDKKGGDAVDFRKNAESDKPDLKIRLGD